MKGLYVRAGVLIFCVGCVLVLFSQIGHGGRSAGQDNVIEKSQHVQHDQGRDSNYAPKATVPVTPAPEPVKQIGRPEPPDYLIPSDSELEQMNENDWMKIYWRYINRLQVLCKDIIRVGSLKDGGKEICVDEPYRPTPPCIVYSFGINYQWDFDKAVSNSFGCQVFSFDPSMVNKSQQVSERIWFHRAGLGPRNEVNRNGWQIHTLDTIQASLGHQNRTIDILKIDIEGDEWQSLLQMISVGSLDHVKQISMETHFSRTTTLGSKYWGNEASYKPLAALRRLHEIGFRIFMRERNEWSFMPWPGIDGRIANVNEISLIKI